MMICNKPTLKSTCSIILLTGIYLTGFSQQKNFNINSFGAKADEKTINTIAIQKAIDKANASGGGKVIIPKGRFVSGVVYLKTGVELHLAQDAVLLGSTNRLDYGKGNAEALITAKGQHHISITGKGKIDGRGKELVKDLLMLLRKGILQDAMYKTKRPQENNRPKLIEFTECSNVTVKDISVMNGAGWVQDYIRCNQVVIDGITVTSTEYWNNDGIDIVNSKNVSITNCYVDAADDAICLKSEGEILDSCVNIYVANCTLRSSASAFKLGTGSKGGFRNIKVRNLQIFDTYRSAIALEAVDGGFLENIDIQNVKAVNTGNALFIRLGHRNTDDQYSTVKNIIIKNIDVQVPAEKPDAGYPVEGPVKNFPHNVFPASIVGLPGHEIEHVTLENIIVHYEGGGSKDNAFFDWNQLQSVPENAAGYPEFSQFGELPAWGLYVRHVNGLTMKNVQLNLQRSDYRVACIFDDVKKLSLSEIIIPSSVQPVIILNNVDKPLIEKMKLAAGSGEAIRIQ